MKKNQSTIWLTVFTLLIIGSFAYIYINKPIIPVIGADGTIKGNYSIESIRMAGQPYECSFTKTDGSSRISGTLQIISDQLRGDFDISLLDKDFASHIIITGGFAYTWTSIGPVGYKGSIAKSASKNASPTEQAQIIGTEDKMDYTCFLWEVNSKLFDIPTGITFTELKN